MVLTVAIILGVFVAYLWLSLLLWALQHFGANVDGGILDYIAILALLLSINSRNIKKD